MRLAGCINTPSKDEIERGYIPEIVTVRVEREPREYAVDELLALRPGGKAQQQRKDFNNAQPQSSLGFKFTKSDDDIWTLLQASRQPGHWHISIRDAIAAMVWRGWSDDAIRFSCAPYCIGGKDDADLDPLIDGARRRDWGKPNPDNATRPQQSATGPQAQQSAEIDFVDMATWDDCDPPPREWTVRDMIPRRNVFLFSGEGAAGKTLLALQLAVAHALGRDWLGTLPEPGPVIFLGAEDETDELHRRLNDILNSYQATFADIKGKLFLMSFAGQDAVLGHTDKRTGLVMATPLYEKLLRAAAEIGPVMICLDTSADVFAGMRYRASRFGSLSDCCAGWQ